MPSDHSHQNIGQTVGAKIRAARLAKKYTQSRLAQPDFSVSYISAIERGQIHPSLRALEILAIRLGLSSSDLLPQASSNNANPSAPSSEAVQSATDIEVQFLEAQIAIWVPVALVLTLALLPRIKGGIIGFIWSTGAAAP